MVVGLTIAIFTGINTYKNYDFAEKVETKKPEVKVKKEVKKLEPKIKKEVKKPQTKAKKEVKNLSLKLKKIKRLRSQFYPI